MMKRLDENISIRDFRKSDLSDILTVARLSFAEEFELIGFDPNYIKKTVDKVFGVQGRVFIGLSKLFGKEPFRLLVAEISKKIVGTTMITRQGKIAYLSTIMVHPLNRRKGIARRLVTHALEYARNERMKRAVLHVVTTNLPAKSLYSTLGFRDFEKIEHLIAHADMISLPARIKGVDLRAFHEKDTSSVYDLVTVSEDPVHLEIFGLKRSDLKTNFIERVFSFATKNQLVAERDDRVVGYGEIGYTTADQAAEIRNVQVSPQMKAAGIEEMLIYSEICTIKKVGVTKFLAAVSKQKPELIAAFERLGFEKRSELDGMVRELD